ncbi:sodium:solute symporter family protein [Bradyrhizobium sp. U87765 SZCCT0131]|uniref:sodium:solute symporter family protein n=1 Tax=unclassified Bradyrhizobium TaxID=2631580 RepID=UPI001BA9F117|nr:MULTISPECIES: sodium:solute symporter family protein [unclassified Bradyrhizobium]MBR1218839.1 sodium:solute symporter family protein [Bradyrhizobium sp. U87765 SZCCT0131]MBR1261490.1 sodium:solute symporter family protein [Bradyrhizobium sp. U87765 SZCCT0134]MBR1306657.1 sodium:solute symporter family protein [Bradyrhizobium sp. U87765 SZCCT0110]MBR1317272.1 sodium:solute symporter family protein [Bradyrhizobium sp. U87765 SZCCT0109]MBR1350974.1 sodium:solute symporter family protein [Brad
MVVTYGVVAIFFALVIWILQRSFVADKSFTDYAVGGRSFGGFYQAMSFLNTWYPGATFVAFAGLSAGAGVLGFYGLTCGLLTVVVMYLMAQRVWIWGSQFDLRTQADLFALRYNSRHIRTVAAVIGIVSSFPWLILGLQALGVVFHALSLGQMSFPACVVIGVLVMVVRQFWTIRMGMRGVVISDMFQGIVAYIGGAILLLGMTIWLVTTQGAGFDKMPARMFDIPGFGSPTGPLYLFALMFTGALGGWCWPAVFVRLYTADGVRSLKQSAAIGVPLSYLFYLALTFFAFFGSIFPEVQAAPHEVFFIVSQKAGGTWMLALAGTVVLAASMGAIDGGIQASGAQIANDIVGNYAKLEHRQMLLSAKLGMLAMTILGAVIACFEIPQLFALAVLAYQGVIQLAVPQFVGIFWKRGNKYGATAGMVCGFVVAVVLEMAHPTFVPWAYGLTSGVIALAVNLVIYVAAAYLIRMPDAERRRVDDMFASVARPAPEASAVTGAAVTVLAAESVAHR